MKLNSNISEPEHNCFLYEIIIC